MDRRMGATTLVSSAIVARFRKGSRLGGLFVGIVGVFAITGWFLDVRVLKSPNPSWATIKANTGVCLVLLGSALMLFGHARHRRATTLLAACALAIAGLTLSQDLFAWNLGIDELLTADPA